jgi:16S rRNA (adenine1518-N6/adenine1519-N6)-dimethyltransferase
LNVPFPLPKATLNRFGLRPKRSFGQNFLCDQHLVEKIAAECGNSGTVVEIGAGLGGLTACLLERGHDVIAIERDRDLLPVLSELASVVNSEFSSDRERSNARLTLLEADAKQVDLKTCFEQRVKPHVLAGNLPYNLTGQLLRAATANATWLDRAVFLVQLEVAERLTALPSSKTYGALTVFTQAAYDVQYCFTVRRGAFYPQPNVDSALVSMRPRLERVEETFAFQRVVNAAFAQRRKTLRNAWKGLFTSGAALEEAARVAQVSLDARGETLTVQDFSRMSEQLEAAA